MTEFISGLWFWSCVLLKNDGRIAQNSLFWRICTLCQRVGEIYPWCQFHQHVYAQLLLAEIPKAQKDSHVNTVFCAFGICARKSWVCVKSTPGVDFTNIFTRRFYARSSQKRKSQSSWQYLFMLLGSACVKAVRRKLMKLSPGCSLDSRELRPKCHQNSGWRGTRLDIWFNLIWFNVLIILHEKLWK